MQEKEPLVSIVVITYNSSKYVLETLESAKEQTYQNIELIISDDGSTNDNTIEICKNWLAENKDRFVNSELLTVEKNTGISANFNRGLRVSSGEWLKFIAGDDVLRSDCIQIYVNYILENPNCFFLHSQVQKYSNTISDDNQILKEDKKTLKFNNSNITVEEQFQILIRCNPVNAPSTFISKKIFNTVGNFNENFQMWEDAPMWISIVSAGFKFHYLDTITVNYRIHSDSATFFNKSNLLFTESRLLKDRYYLNYSNNFGLLERIIKWTNYKRKIILQKMGLNNSSKFSSKFNTLTGFIFEYYIAKINEKYKYNT